MRGLTDAGSPLLTPNLSCWLSPHCISQIWLTDDPRSLMLLMGLNFIIHTQTTVPSTLPLFLSHHSCCLCASLGCSPLLQYQCFPCRGGHHSVPDTRSYTPRLLPYFLTAYTMPCCPHPIDTVSSTCSLAVTLHVHHLTHNDMKNSICDHK